MNRLEKDVWIANKDMQRYSRLLAIRNMQIKSTMRDHCIPFRTVKMNNNNTKC